MGIDTYEIITPTKHADTVAVAIGGSFVSNPMLRLLANETVVADRIKS